MARAAAAPHVLLALCVHLAGALRDRGGLAAFACPAECQECCTVPLAMGLGVSGARFKCILGNSSELPAGRTCTAPTRRWHSKAQSKTTCDFSPEEARSRAWDGLEGKCSKRSQCCCSLKEDWTERICMGMGTTVPHVFTVSQRSQAREKYERQPQQYDNKDATCAPEQDGVPEGKTYQTHKRAALTGRGCCLETERRSTREHYQCGSQCTPMSPGGMHCTPQYCHRDVAWTGCARWQRLYHCTNDGGFTQTGQMYQRVPSKPGMCVGDHSTPERLLHAHRIAPGETSAAALEGFKLRGGRCPATSGAVVAGRRCQCGVDCGN